MGLHGIRKEVEHEYNKGPETSMVRDRLAVTGCAARR